MISPDSESGNKDDIGNRPETLTLALGRFKRRDFIGISDEDRCFLMEVGDSRLEQRLIAVGGTAAHGMYQK